MRSGIDVFALCGTSAEQADTSTMWFNVDGFFIFGAVFVIFLIGSLFYRRPARDCPRCGEVNRESAVFCSQCGDRLPSR
jgi:hypothetical protein